MNIFLRISCVFFFSCQNNNAVTSRGKDLDKLAKDLEKLEDQSRVDQEAHVSAQKQYQAVTAGLSSNDDGQAATLNDQLMSRYSLL